MSASNALKARMRELAAEAESLMPYCQSDGQRSKMQAVVDKGGVRAAALSLNVSPNTITQNFDIVRRYAAARGFSPAHDMTRPVPDGFIAKGVSTYYDKDGKPTGQWVKSSLKESAAKLAMQHAIAELAKDTKRAKPLASPKHPLHGDLCNLITLTDCHVGMRAWAKETGADWDLEIAENTLFEAARYLLASSPKAGTGIVAQLGDWLHFDSLAAITPTSGHLLDADSRFSKVVETSIRLLRNIIDLALQHHERVIVLMAEGNHDLASAVWLRHVFKLLYEKEPRIQVIDSELPYYVHQHGETMLCWHHGHLAKIDKLPQIMAANFAPIWGATKKRYCHTGHLHHVHEKEHPGITVIQHPTIAAPDAYAVRNGWLSERQITSITYHSKHGQVARNTVTPEMLT